VAQACPGGESFADLCDRPASFLREVRQSPAKNIMVVTHGGIIRAYQHLELGAPAVELFQKKINFGEVVCVGF
jgi:alpha-ribazole phosphatase